MLGSRNRMKVWIHGLEICVLGKLILARVEKSL